MFSTPESLWARFSTGTEELQISQHQATHLDHPQIQLLLIQVLQLSNLSQARDIL
jgi:hypothetical protein